ncbi:MAG: hypothetical protein LC744_04855 [Chloroflexi bacterium]|nr:hypothetical protein [Chloroflexota bacterium]
MAELTKRLQVLVDERRFTRLEEGARRHNTTVAALVRESIDRMFPPDSLSTREAADRFLERPAIDFGDWDQAKREIEEDLERAGRD